MTFEDLLTIVPKAQSVAGDLIVYLDSGTISLGALGADGVTLSEGGSDYIAALAARKGRRTKVADPLPAPPLTADGPPPVEPTAEVPAAEPSLHELLS